MNKFLVKNQGNCSFFDYNSIEKCRSNDALCGPSARFFEKKQSDDNSTEYKWKEKEYKKYELVDDCTRFFPFGSTINKYSNE